MSEQSTNQSADGAIKIANHWDVVLLGDVAAINPRENDNVEDDSLVSFIPMKCVEEESGRFISLGDRKIV
jgi:hypothetical protein